MNSFEMNTNAHALIVEKKMFNLSGLSSAVNDIIHRYLADVNVDEFYCVAFSLIQINPF